MKIISKGRDEKLFYVFHYNLGTKHSHPLLNKSLFGFDTFNFNILYKGPNGTKIDSLYYITFSFKEKKGLQVLKK